MGDAASSRGEERKREERKRASEIMSLATRLVDPTRPGPTVYSAAVYATAHWRHDTEPPPPPISHFKFNIPNVIPVSRQAARRMDRKDPNPKLNPQATGTHYCLRSY